MGKPLCVFLLSNNIVGAVKGSRFCSVKSSAEILCLHDSVCGFNTLYGKGNILYI